MTLNVIDNLTVDSGMKQYFRQSPTRINETLYANYIILYWSSEYIDNDMFSLVCSIVSDEGA